MKSSLTCLPSLRDRIGIVPQNPILFDDTIMNNVRYGRITASDEEVFDACRAASIHDKIASFTQGKDEPRASDGRKILTRQQAMQPELVNVARKIIIFAQNHIPRV